MATQRTGAVVGAPTKKAGTSFWSTSVNWLRVIRIAVWPVALILAAVFVPMIWGWYPVLGHSMQPTLPYIGGYYHLDRNAIPQVGNIIKFAAPNDGRICIKRVTAISPDKHWFWVSADNKGVTGEDSDNYGSIHQSRIVGTVTHIWTLSRSFRFKTAEGQMRGWVETNYSLDAQHWSPCESSVVVDGNPLRAYSSRGKCLAVLPNSYFAAWHGDNQFVFWPDRLHEIVRLYDIRSGAISKADSETEFSLAQNPIRPRKQPGGLIWLAKPKADRFRWDKPRNGFCQLFLYGRWDNLCPYGHKLVIEAGGKRHKADLINTADIDLQSKKQCTLICLFDVNDQERPSGVPTILASP